MGDTSEDMFVRFTEKLTAEMKTLGDRLESAFSQSIQTVNLQLKAQAADISDIKESITYTSTEVETLKTENENLKHSLSYYENRTERLERVVEEMQEKLVDVTTRSMRDNLIFHHIPEDKDETNEHTRQKIVKFMKESLKIREADTISMDRVHRMGKKLPSKDRPIVVKFNPYRGKEVVLQNVKNLKGTNYRVQEQFPPEVEEKRRDLLAIARQKKETAEKQGQGINYRLRGDKLWLNGELYKAPTQEKFIFTKDDIEGAKKIAVAHSEVITVNDSTFQGHAARINTSSEVKPTILKSYADNKLAASATHTIYAYRIREKGKMRENYADDGEIGAGRHLLNLLQSKGMDNIMVVVSRWYGGKKIGPDRFDAIKQVAQKAINGLGI